MLRDYYITEDNYLKINIECPGETTVNAEIVNDYHYIEITGNRKKFNPEGCKSIGIERENGDFSLLIPTDYILEDTDEEIPKHDGIQTFVFHIFDGKKKKKNQ